MVELEEQGTRVALTIVDTPGFGDMIDNNVTYAFLIYNRVDEANGATKVWNRIRLFGSTV